MFYRGTIQSFDPVSKIGEIYITDLESGFQFHLKDLPNFNVTPTIGERVKCNIIEQDGMVKLNFIIRLDTHNASKQPLEKNVEQQVATHHLNIHQGSIHGTSKLPPYLADKTADRVASRSDQTSVSSVNDKVEQSENLIENSRNVELSRSGIILDSVEHANSNDAIIIKETENINIPEKLKANQVVDLQETRDSSASASNFKKIKAVKTNASMLISPDSNEENYIYFEDDQIIYDQNDSEIVFHSDLDDMQDEDIEFTAYREDFSIEYDRNFLHDDSVRTMQMFNQKSLQNELQSSAGILKFKKQSLIQSLKNRMLYSKYKVKASKQKKPSIRINPWFLVLICLVPIAIIISNEGYKQYQSYVEDRETKARLYQIEQERIIEEQRRKLGSLPTKILSDKTLDELLGKDRVKNSDKNINKK